MKNSLKYLMLVQLTRVCYLMIQELVIRMMKICSKKSLEVQGVTKRKLLTVVGTNGMFFIDKMFLSLLSFLESIPKSLTHPLDHPKRYSFSLLHFDLMHKKWLNRETYIKVTFQFSHQVITFYRFALIKFIFHIGCSSDSWWELLLGCFP